MTLSLYAATVPTYLQMLGSVLQLLDKAEAFCAEKGISPADMIDARLAPDMFPFGFQVKSAAVHSFGAIDAVRKGLFSPNRDPWPDSFAGLRAMVAQARDALGAIKPADLEGLVGKPMRFEAGDIKMEFAAEDYLLSFAQPNFYFHAAIAFAILRMKGVQVGKRDWLGAMRMKG